MTELSVEEEYDEQTQGVQETDTENQEDQPLFLTEDDIPEQPGDQMMSHAASSSARMTLQGGAWLVVTPAQSWAD